MIKKHVTALLSLVALQLCAEDWTQLLDKDLSNFEIWMGIPHVSVEGLPEGTPLSEDCHKGVPLGLNADIKNVFTMEECSEEPVLHISGEIFGSLITLKEYENYHFSVKFKWADKKWEPRLDLLRDNGILYHSHGEHGAFWGVWKSSLEYQVQETDLGDFIQIAGPKAEIRTSKVEGTKRRRFDLESDEYTSGYISAYPEPDAPHGEWNHLELYALGDTSVHVVNGVVVMIVENAKKEDGSPLTRGQIQIQSEAAECYYKQIKIRDITAFPESIQKLIR